MTLTTLTKRIQQIVGVTPDGAYGPATANAVLKRLGDSAAAPQGFDRIAFAKRFTNTSAPAIDAEDVKSAAARLNVPVGHISAIAKVESAGQSFDNSGRLIILPEPHIFYRETGGRFGRKPFSYPKWGERPYPGSYDARWTMLADMASCDYDAALRSASIGKFQIMGFNYAACGYASVQAMWDGFTANEDDHLESLVEFILSEGLDDELRACRRGDPASCVAFVSRYNGAGYKKNRYHEKLAAAL